MDGCDERRQRDGEAHRSCVRIQEMVQHCLQGFLPKTVTLKENDQYNVGEFKDQTHMW